MKFVSRWRIFEISFSALKFVEYVTQILALVRVSIEKRLEEGYNWQMEVCSSNWALKRQETHSGNESLHLAVIGGAGLLTWCQVIA